MSYKCLKNACKSVKKHKKNFKKVTKNFKHIKLFKNITYFKNFLKYFQTPCTPVTVKMWYYLFSLKIQSNRSLFPQQEFFEKWFLPSFWRSGKLKTLSSFEFFLARSMQFWMVLRILPLKMDLIQEFSFYSHFEIAPCLFERIARQSCAFCNRR